MSTAGPSADAKKAQAAALDELEVAQRKKRALDGQLAKRELTPKADLETAIYRFEASYLDETAASGGNIIKGFDNYLKPQPANANKKKVEPTEADRLFSSSSGTYKQSLEAKSNHEALQQQMAENTKRR